MKVMISGKLQLQQEEGKHNLSDILKKKKNSYKPGTFYLHLAFVTLLTFPTVTLNWP